MPQYTQQQWAAIHRVGQDACVIAGPGSGKTSVLVERFAWLVRKQGVSPRNILAITFTEKAANEIRERVGAVIEEVELAPISTLHGLCTRVLKEFSLAAGLDPSWALWDARDAQAELSESARTVLNAAAREERAELRRLFTAWNSFGMVDDLCGLHERIMGLSGRVPKFDEPRDVSGDLARLRKWTAQIAALEGPTDAARKKLEEYRGWYAEHRGSFGGACWELVEALASVPKMGTLPKQLKEIAAGLHGFAQQLAPDVVSLLTREEARYLVEILERTAEEYHRRKTAQARIDFHDLEHITVGLLESREDIRGELQRRFEHILMDEMQDTNPIQWEIVNLLRSPGNLFAVGDVNQSIFSFRFAAPALFQQYRAEVETAGGEVDFLSANFRSREGVLEFTEAVCGGLGGIEKPNLSARREFRFAQRAVSVHPFEDAAAELDFLTSEIRRLLAEGGFAIDPKRGGPLRALRCRDIAVLVRKSEMGESVAAALGRAGIPFTLGGGQRFFGAQEVQDCLFYLRLLANETDTAARAAVLRSPFAGLSDAELLEQAAPVRFQQMLARHRKRGEDVGPDRLIAEAMDTSGYWNTLDAAGRANVEKFLRLTREEWAKGPRNRRDFADRMESLRMAGDEKSAPVAESDDAVQILTVHTSKGLEFPVVFLAGAGFRDRQPTESLFFHPDVGVGIRWLHPRTGKGVADRRGCEIKARLKIEADEERNRLMYVALTRAEQRLYVSWGNKRKEGWRKEFEGHVGFGVEVTDLMPFVASAGLTEAAAVELLRPYSEPPVWISTATPSDLATFSQCPRRYFLDRVAGLGSWTDEPDEEADGRRIASKELGTQVHELLAGLEVEGLAPEAAELAARFVESDLGRRAAAAVSEKEFDFVFAVDGLVIQGAIDLWFDDGEEIVVVDYKTDQVSGVEKAPAYSMQMAVYREALGRMFPGRRVRSYLHFLRPDMVAESAEELDLELLRRFRERPAYEPAPAEHCLRCPHMGGACEVMFEV
jgi:ATP-dependent helicase/nuclease subunit A